MKINAEKLFDIGFYSIIAFTLNFLAILVNLILTLLGITAFYWWLVWLFIALYFISLGLFITYMIIDHKQESDKTKKG